MESGDLPLESLLARFEEGTRLVKTCQAKLEEAELKISMRYWYPDEFKQLLRSQRFEITGAWGGYAGEVYGAGPELVLEFAEPAT